MCLVSKRARKKESGPSGLSKVIPKLPLYIDTQKVFFFFLKDILRRSLVTFFFFLILGHRRYTHIGGHVHRVVVQRWLFAFPFVRLGGREKKKIVFPFLVCVPSSPGGAKASFPPLFSPPPAVCSALSQFLLDLPITPHLRLPLFKNFKNQGGEKKCIICVPPVPFPNCSFVLFFPPRASFVVLHMPPTDGK